MPRTRYHYLSEKSHHDARSEHPLFEQKSRSFVICDAAFQSISVPENYGAIMRKNPVKWIEAGEQSKTLQKAEELWAWLETEGVDRFDEIIVIGGGDCPRPWSIRSSHIQTRNIVFPDSYDSFGNG